MRYARPWLTCGLTIAVTWIAATSSFAQEGLPDRFTTEDTRLTTGIDRSAASSTDPSQHFLIDFMLTAPLSSGPLTRKSKPSWAAWINTRFTGSPTQSVAGVKQFVGGFEQDLVAGNTGTLLDTLNAIGGIEKSISNGFTFGDDYQLQPVLIAAIGLTTTAVSQPVIFDLKDVSATVRHRFNVPDNVAATATTPAVTYNYLGLVNPDRHRFYRQYAVGLRLKTHHFDHESDSRVNFPGIVDVTAGRNEAITGGLMKGYVLRLDAFYPLPTNNLANAIYFFGTAEMQRTDPSQNPDEQDPVILRAPSATVALPSPDLWVHTLTSEERTRDQWKFGVGVDLVRLFAAAGKARAEAECSETGFSRATQIDTTEVTVVRMLAQKAEETCFRHVTDIILPLGDLKFVSTRNGGGSETLVFPKETPAPVSDTVRKLRNAGSDSASLVLIRIKTQPPGDVRPINLTFFSMNASQTTKDSSNPRYDVIEITCAMNCPSSAAAVKGDDALVIIPLEDSKRMVKVGTDDKTVARYAPIFVPRNTETTVGGDAMAGFHALVIRIH